MRTTFQCIDAHTCGNPVRVVRSSMPVLKGDSMSERRIHFIKEFDWIRRGLMFEPRGHDMMSGSLIYPPILPQHDASILFIETSGCLPMCGHGTIGTVTIAIEEKLIVPKIPGQLLLETPAGIVAVEYKQVNGKVTSVKLTNVPSFLAQTDLLIASSAVGNLHVDVAYGGNFYAIIDVQENFPGLEYFSADQLISMGRQLRQSLNESYSFVHPLDSSIHGCSHVLWTGKPVDPSSIARGAVLYGEKAIDRSPCGTGTSARMAQWYAKNRLQIGQPFIHESIIGSKFTGEIKALSTVGEYPAIIPTIEGWATVTGYNTIIIDDTDPYANGFQVV